MSNLYITNISLKNVRCFEDLNVTFEGLGESILLLGENGKGKSTILRAITMGLCDQSSASALFRELPGEYVRRWSGRDDNQKRHLQGSITIDLADENCQEFRIITEINGWYDNFERVDQKVFKGCGKKAKEIESESFPWGEIFITAYGPGLRVKGSEDFQDYLAVDAVYSLFRYDEGLQNPELVMRRLRDDSQGNLEQLESKLRRGTKQPIELRRIKQAEKLLGDLNKILGRLLDLPDGDSILLTDRGITLRQNGEDYDLSELGDGYRATVTWVVDMLAWWFLFLNIGNRGKQNKKNLNAAGIVIIDEIEQHLHPAWQTRILETLHQTFPAVQFITSTHSPLVASSCEDVSVHFIRSGDTKTTKESPYGWRAEEVYELMGLTGSRVAEFRENTLEPYKLLDMKRIQGTATKKDLKRLHNLERKVARTLPEGDPAALIQELKNIQNYLKQH